MSTVTAPAPDVIGRCGAGHVVTGLWADVRAGWIACGCGRHAVAKGFAAKVTAKACDGRCTSAVGPSCSCECGGRNHGADRRF